MRWFLPALIAALGAVPWADCADAADGKASPDVPAVNLAASVTSEWQSYASRFVTAEGRVVDNANAGISHSEGQGYGLLLAAKAGDAGRFDAIWGWTARSLMIRKDGLASWKWDPVARKVTDTNNATDGDILIAWGLAEGAKRFNRADYRQAAVAIARAVGAHALIKAKSGPILLPGIQGFRSRDRPDGPIVNLSYWVFPAFPTLKDLVPTVPWESLRLGGLSLLKQSAFGAFALPTEWESVAGPRPRPAAHFPATFGYNAIRLPLYLAMDGTTDTHQALARFAGAWTRTTPPVAPGSDQPADVSVPSDQPGYNLVFAVARCAASGEHIPSQMISTRSEFYYSETLRLLSIIAIQEKYSSCL